MKIVECLYVGFLACCVLFGLTAVVVISIAYPLGLLIMLGVVLFIGVLGFVIIKIADHFNI
jgi:hypothetical protein